MYNWKIKKNHKEKWGVGIQMKVTRIKQKSSSKFYKL